MLSTWHRFGILRSLHDFNLRHSPSRHVLIMTPVSDGSDIFDLDEKGEVIGEQSRSLSELHAARSQGMATIKLSRSLRC
jgi:hypothetical protein